MSRNAMVAFERTNGQSDYFHLRNLTAIRAGGDGGAWCYAILDCGAEIGVGISAKALHDKYVAYQDEQDAIYGVE